MDEWMEQLALFIAHREDGHGWADDCPQWVRERYRDAAKAAWQVVVRHPESGAAR